MNLACSVCRGVSSFDHPPDARDNIGWRGGRRTVVVGRWWAGAAFVMFMVLGWVVVQMDSALNGLLDDLERDINDRKVME